jgi:hypothetical protein
MTKFRRVAMWAGASSALVALVTLSGAGVKFN